MQKLPDPMNVSEQLLYAIAVRLDVVIDLLTSLQNPNQPQFVESKPTPRRRTRKE